MTGFRFQMQYYPKEHRYFLFFQHKYPCSSKCLIALGRNPYGFGRVPARPSYLFLGEDVKGGQVEEVPCRIYPVPKTTLLHTLPDLTPYPSHTIIDFTPIQANLPRTLLDFTMYPSRPYPAP